jgi:hypothetical protein
MKIKDESCNSAWEFVYIIAMFLAAWAIAALCHGIL